MLSTFSQKEVGELLKPDLYDEVVAVHHIYISKEKH